LTIVAFTVLSSCKISKDLEAPRDAVPQSYRHNNSSSDTLSVADISWKSFFADQDLLALIDSAVTRNYDLQVAQKNIEIAQFRFTQSKWGNIPQANLQVTASSARVSENSLNAFSLNQALGRSHIEDYSAGIGLSWEADIWGKIKNKKKEAMAQYLYSEETKKALQTIIVANTAKGYYNLLMLDAQLAIAEKNLKLNDSTLAIIKLQFDSGHMTSLGIQQAEAQRLVAAQLLPQLQQNISVQENALSILAGSFPDAKRRSAKLSAVGFDPSIASGVPASLVNRRPDVRAAELILKASNARVGISKAYLYPALTITAAGGVNSFEASNWFTMPASLFGTIAGGLTQPLLNGKKLRTEFNVAKTEREKSVLQFRQAVLVAVGEVSDAQIQAEKIETRKGIISERVKVLELAVRNANLLFKNGMATYLEVIVAQGNLLQSELELASTQREALSVNVELYRALGGGWK